MTTRVKSMLPGVCFGGFGKGTEMVMTMRVRLLEEEWPDEAEITAARIKEREAAVPVPERVWSLRNVAGTLGLGGPAERRRARHFLEQAVRLKEAWLENSEHPGAPLIDTTTSLTHAPAFALVLGLRSTFHSTQGKFDLGHV